MAKHHNGEYYVKAAEHAGLRVEHSIGSHAKVYGGDGRCVVVPTHRKELPTGTECQVRKLFLRVLGLAVCIPFVIGIINALTP